MAIYSENDKLKKEINSLFPIKNHEKIKHQFNFLLTSSSCLLNGNILNLTEMEEILKKGITINIYPLNNEITINGKSIINHFEVIGFNNALNFILTKTDKSYLSFKFILKIHKLLYQRFNKKQAGRIRDQDFVDPYFDHPLPAGKHVKQLMKKFEKRIELFQKNLHPVEFAAKIHLEFLEISPFMGANWNVARLLVNYILFQHDYTYCIIPPEDGKEYRRMATNPHIKEREFINYISATLKKSQREFLGLIKENQPG